MSLPGYDAWKLATPDHYEEPECASCSSPEEHVEHEEHMAEEVELARREQLAEGPEFDKYEHIPWEQGGAK